jgi:hypothetical protein
MRAMPIKRFACHLLPALVGLASVQTSGFAQEIGSAGAVNPASTGMPPGRPTRVLELGARVIHKERIRTTGSGSVQLIFLDKTTLNIGPNSDIVIDEFVYDPNRGSGQMAVSMAKGVLRFVGGNVSHAGGATVKTPAATLGIRGGVATIKHNPCDGSIPAFQHLECGTRAINHFGVLTVTTLAGTEVIRRPGFAVTIPNAGSSPPAPTRVSQAEIDETNQELSSKPGQSGGAPVRPTEAIVAQAGVGNLNANIAPSLISGQQQTVAGRPLNGPTLLAQIQQVTQTLARQATNTAVQAAVAILVEERRAAERERLAQERLAQERLTTTPVNARAFALVTTPDPALNSSIPFVLGAGVARGGVTVSPILGYRNAGTADEPVPPGRTLQVAFGVSGQGAAQSSNLMVATGEFRPGADRNLIFSGGFGATSQSASQAPVVTRGNIASLPGSVKLDAERLPLEAIVNQNRIDSSGAVVASLAVQRPGVSDVSYSFQQNVAQTATPANLGQARPERTLDGFAGGWVAGLVTTLNGSGQVIDRRGVLGGNFVNLDPGDSRVQVNQFISTVPVSNSSSAQPVGGLAAAQMQFGSIDRTQPAQSAYIDYDNFGAREASQNPVTGVTSVSAVSSTSGITFSSGNDEVRRSTLIMTTASPANVQAAFPGVTFCQCEFTRWGFWSAEVERNGPSGSFTDRIHVGTWVAGQMPDSTEVPTTGTASYSGHLIANIQNGANQYLAAGNYSNTLNFGTRSGAVNVSNLDGRNYAGSMSLPAGVGAPLVFGNLTTTAGPSAQMALFGNLYRGATSPVGEIGGWAVINGGASYGGTGTFAARMVGGIAP